MGLGTQQTARVDRGPVLRAATLRWVWLLALLAAPVLLTALLKDIGGLSYDAAGEHIPRAVVFSQIINDGVLYPRWAQFLHLGLGSPLFTFQPPLPYYALHVLAELGLSHPLGWRWLMAAGFAVAFGGAYLLVKELTGRRWAALAAATAYLYAPYILRNAIERGSNEAYSIFLYPVVLWSLLWLAKRPSFGRFLLATLAWAVCIGCHVLGPLMLAPFALLLGLGIAWRRRTVAPLLALLAGGLLTAFIWLPMGAPAGGEQRWVHIERDFSQPDAIPATNPIRLDDLFAPPAVYDVARGNNNVGDRVGLFHSLAVLAGIPAAVYAWRRNRALAVALMAATAVGVFLLFLFAPWSDWLWRLGGSLAAKLLYRTRLMGVEALAAAAVAGLSVAVLPVRWQRIAGPVTAAVFVLAAIPSLYVELQHRYGEFQLPLDLPQVRATEIRTNGSALAAFGEFTPLMRTAPFDEQALAELGADFDAGRDPLAGGDLTVRSADVRNQRWELQVSASAATTATLHLLYYPRWQATVDGAPVPVSYQPETGYLQAPVPAGEHSLVLTYAITPWERLGLIVSGLTGLTLVVVGVGWRRRGALANFSEAPETHPNVDAARVPLWSLLALTGLLAVKVLVLDPNATVFRCVSSETRVCGAQATAKAAFVDAPGLRGYSVSTYEARPGEELRITLFWQGTDAAPRRLSTFIHVRTSMPDQPGNPRSENGMWVQAERVAPGGLVTTDFQPGKLYEDVYRLRLPDDMPAGPYFLEVGWFDPATGEQADVLPESVQPPLRILWRSVLLPNLNVVANR